jgi:hypothetical protein
MFNQEVVTYNLETLTYRRPDGTFVGIVGGFPYHVIPEDPYGLWEKAVDMAEEMGSNLEFEPAPQLLVVSRPITARQLRIALLNIGITGSIVTSTINEIDNVIQKEIMLVEWEYGSTYNRDDNLIKFIETRFNVGTESFDSFWELASKI